MFFKMSIKYQKRIKKGKGKAKKEQQKRLVKTFNEGIKKDMFYINLIRYFGNDKNEKKDN